jgi:drug/metabolite transporter (DMT)-like permease
MSATSLAIVLLIAGNFVASLADVSVKNLDGDLSAVQYTFLRQCMSLVLVAPFWYRQQPVERALTHVRITLLRAQLILVGSGCTMLAITYLPLATANAGTVVANTWGQQSRAGNGLILLPGDQLHNASG